tara:strand:+ start:282 stop:701 length:420 start_codon:yes stop_codon:yes gene_type:complete
MVSIFEDISVITTSRKEKLNGIAFPVVAGTGGYFSKSEGFNTILGGLKQLLLTNKGERVMFPDYGTNLRSYVFEQDTPQLRSKIKEDVYNAIAVYAKRVEISNYELLMRDLSGKNTILISLTLRLKNDYTQQRILELII